MTDSMKFGPEWLRNMSADSNSSNNTSGQVTNSTSALGSGNSSSGGDGSSVNIANNSNPSSLNTSSLQNNISSASSRNTFPEFRYGREEMLLLFDRNCGIPEILPSYKNLFVERVQFPLALVPSTDEEMMQGSVPTGQRPGWLQRSPVGFSTATRGTGRIGSIERGRMRGKSVYHPVFQRPNALFDEEQRSSATKVERSWAERNGGVVSDPSTSGASTIGGGGLAPDVWNGNTPGSSPRREFSNHPRNMENWRRNRNEDVSSGETTAATTLSADGGWRMNTSGFQNSHARWGRSTSWRDDDLSHNENAGISGGSITAVSGGGGAMMLRSNSTISTTHGERMGQPGKPLSVPGVLRSISAMSSGARNSVSGNIWPNNSSLGPIPNMQSECNPNDEMALPEWAMENPSDIGGTFDASGAFHGGVDDDCKSEKHLKDEALQQSPSREQVPSRMEVKEKLSKMSDNNSIKSMKSQKNLPFKETDSYQNSSSPSPTPHSTITATHENTEENDKLKHNNNTSHKPVTSADLVAPEIVSQKNSETHSDNEYTNEAATNSSTNVQKYSTASVNNENDMPNSNIGDYAERMMKVTDDMIEKLIMDDEDGKDDHIKSSMMSGGNNKINAHNMFMTLQQSQNSSHQSRVSPSLGNAGPAGLPSAGLYNMGGLMVDHSHNMVSLHQLQQQQMAAVAAVAIGLQPTAPPPHSMTSSAPTDLWLYRDPQAKVQGPFSALEMTEWYRAGYFNENLFVRRVCDARFRPLGELIKICNGQIPFSHSQLIPIDLNPTALTPPLPPVISAQPSVQATDFLIKTLNEQQQQQQHEKLKGSVTAAADSLSNALKSLINSVDISQVLNMHFQTLQDRFIHNQEIEIVNELSKNECFRRLSPAEQDTVVRQKLQTLGLPEYLTNLTGLSNSLAALNPTAGTQLYNTIAECTKKEQLFSNHQGQQQSQTPASQQQQQQLSTAADLLQQRTNIHLSSSSTPYMTAEDFIIKTKGSDMNSNDLINEFNLRMFINNGSESGGRSTGGVTPNSHGHEFLNDQQLFGAGANPTTNPSNNASQSPMMQMWMNSLATNAVNPLPNQQHSLLGNAPQAGALNNQWLNNPLVGINSISLSSEQQGSPKPTPASMWDIGAVEQVQRQHLHHEQQLQHETFDHQRDIKETEKHLQDQDVNKQTNKQDNRQEVHQKVATKLQKCYDAVISSTNDSNYKQEHQSQSQTQQQLPVNEKFHSQGHMNKRTSNNNNIASKTTSKGKNEIVVDHISKKTEEERRREQNEEKRRQKEERKRLQMEDEKRRIMQAEEEKRRQIQEEEKRQQQIQAQRRKALMSNNVINNSAANNNCNSNNANNTSCNSVTSAGALKSKEQQRIQSSVAPWSTQTMAIKSQGPGLAEIQKAERRERRADQQRQLEIQEKHLRALAAAADAQDTVLKWNAAPLQVKSFAEIQAEEAKRLVHEQMEVQRRKDQEAHNNLVAFGSTGNAVTSGLNNSSNIASIWTGNKIWGTSGNTSGFWDEPAKCSKPLSATVLNNNNNTNLTAASIVSLSSNLQPKASTTQQQQHNFTTQLLSNKNIKKSQSVAVMQNTACSLATSSGGVSSIQNKPPHNTGLTSKQAKPQKADNNKLGTAGGANNDRKTTSKMSNSANKSDDYETEFTIWCTKSLNNMNTKVDVPTFVSFLRDLESPYEVKDYIRMYLGESKEYIDFAKQFLERRSKYKNLQRAQNAHDDDLCKPAQAITPSVNESSDNKGKQKKVKKNKMTKLDARILGFSVTAAEGRINVGDRDYVDAP